MSRVINGDTILPEVPEMPEKTRLDVMMVGIFRSYNRSTLQRFIENGFVTVDGEVAKKPNQKFEEGVKIELKVPEELKNADVKPEILYEDDDVLVVNKPAGLLSEAKGEYCPERTLADFGLIAHRLDRDTSGVMILAKTPEVQKFLKKQFQARTVHKTYYAVVPGELKLKEAQIKLPMLRDLKRPTTFRIDPNGKESETYYRVVRSDGQHSLVELKPTTGRTHQLRVHMKYLGHPIVGDRVYGEEPAERLFLHARELEITLPGGKRRTFVAELPGEFETMVGGGDARMDGRGGEVGDIRAEDTQTGDARAENVQIENMQARDMLAENVQARDMLAENVQARDMLAENVQIENMQAGDVRAENFGVKNRQPERTESKERQDNLAIDKDLDAE